MKYSGRRGRFERGSHVTKRGILPVVLIPVFLVIMAISIVELLRPEMEQSEYEDLSAIVHISDNINDTNTMPPQINTNESQQETATETDAESLPLPTETELIILAQYEPIYEKNSDFFGWIQIAGTAVDYPVMHTPNDPEFYLRKDFYGDYSVSGVPFLSAECYEGCGNYIIYGHNMKNGSMFNTIMSYRDENFWREHPTIDFDTLYQSGEYEIFAVLYSEVYDVDEAGVFRVYNYCDLSEEQFFNEFTRQAKEASIYNTGVEASFGDEFITLITCSYHVKNGRFVVIAKRI